MNGKRAAFHSLGCKVNAYETEAMMESLKRAGYEIVPFAPGADVYVINTCTVTNVADRKSRQMLHKAKEMNPFAVVVAAGCYVQDASEKLKADPAVDIIVGNNDKSALAAILDGYFSGKEKTDYVDNIGTVRQYEALEVSRTEGRTRAFMKIQDGCNQFCSYCMIPYVRGRVRSRDLQDIRREAERLSRAGYREIILTGIHISSYGIDLDHPGQNLQTPNAREAETNRRLLGLIRAVSSVEGVERVRLGSLEPGIMTGEFVREIARIPEICPQFHLSLQSGCDATLERMRRKYDTESFAKIVDTLRRYFDHPAITTDIITGFPGENEEEFARTVAFVKKIRFAKTHIFKYSSRQGTRAAAMPDQNPESVKHERSRVLIGIDRGMHREFASWYEGKKVEVLFEEPKTVDGRSYMAGHTREYLEALCPMEGKTAESLEGRIVTLPVRAVTSGGDLIV